MGLLTDTKQRQALLRLILRYHQKLSVLLYIVGLVWFLALAYQPLNASTYFSENALLPGLVESNLPQDFFTISSYANAMKEEIGKEKKVVPKGWIVKQFQDLGLETYHQNFTIKYPFRMAISQDIVGENIFAILRARRAASTEALVMSAPLRPSINAKTNTDGSVALMLALASEFRKNPYWAKDVIFLLTEFEEVGVQAWLDAYHESKSQYVIAEDLPARSGAIQAAINLELPNKKVHYLNLKLEGLNGQLPNLDLFNLAVRLSRREHVFATLHYQHDHQDQESWEGFQHTLSTMLKMMWSQASGAPSGNHGMFHKFHIEALTIEGVHQKKGPRSFSLEQVSRVVEGIFRSLNNLLERFHQSFFFYLLPSTDRYVSIGLYMPPFGLMAAAGIVKTLALWIMTHSATDSLTDKQASDTKKTEDISEDEKCKKSDHKSAPEEEEEEENNEDESFSAKDRNTNADKPHPEEGKDEQNFADDNRSFQRKNLQHNDLSSQEKKKDPSGERVDPAEQLRTDDLDPDDLDIENTSVGLLSVVPVVLIAYLLALMTYTAPYVLTLFSPGIKMQATDAILYGILAVFCAGLAYPYLMNRKAVSEERISGDWRLLKCVGLIVQALTLFAVSLINISLAFFLTAVSVPITMAIKPTNSLIFRCAQQLALIVISPMGILCMAAIINIALSNHESFLFAVLWNAVDEVKQLLFFLLVDHYLFYSWTFTLASFAFLPTWLLFWAITFCDI